MMKKLRAKIFIGFMLLVALLIVAGTVSIYEFIKISSSVNALIEDNYKTIIASKSMLEALEREDSGILLLLLGKWKEGRQIIQEGDKNFIDALGVASSNLTEPNEDKYILKIDSAYSSFREKWERPIAETEREGDINWYYQNIHSDFLNVKYAINRLMELNQTSMHNEASLLKDKSRRAIMPGIVAIVCALLFSVLFNFFISRYFVSPITRLVKALKNYSPGSGVFNAKITTEDEIKELESSIANVINEVSTRQPD